MEWLYIVITMCGNPVDGSLYNTKTNEIYEHLTKREAEKIIIINSGNMTPYNIIPVKPQLKLSPFGVSCA